MQRPDQFKQVVHFHPANRDNSHAGLMTLSLVATAAGAVVETIQQERLNSDVRLPPST